MKRPERKRRGICWTLLVTCILSICGCSSPGGIYPTDSRKISLTSYPSGAGVFADGNQIGTTPLTFSPGEAFRSGFAGSDSAFLGYRYVGKLSVKQAGCSDYLVEVNDALLSKDIHVQLECDPDFRPDTAPARPAAGEAASTSPATAQSAERRLLQIEDLHDKGLLREEEYR